MSTQIDTSLEAILRDLNLPPASSKIYRELLTNGEAPARLLSERLRMTRPSTYDHLAILKNKGLVVEKKIGSKTYFGAGDVREIGNALQEKIEVLTEHEKIFTTMLPQLLSQSKTEAPVIKFVKGVEGLHFLIYDVLWNKGETIYTMWPHEEMQKVVGKDTLIRFNDKRIREKITVHALWPKTMKPTKEYIWDGKDVLTKRKYAPSKMTWTMGYTIYGDKVSFISSHKEVFGFIVQSVEFASLMKMQFDALWAQATEK